jgi:hypothetical protein
VLMSEDSSAVGVGIGSRRPSRSAMFGGMYRLSCLRGPWKYRQQAVKGADSKVGTPSPRSPICGEERKRSKVSQRSHHHYYHHYVVCTYQLSHVAVNSTEIGDGSSGGGRLLEEEEQKVSAVVTSRETEIARCDSAISRIPWQQGGK